MEKNEGLKREQGLREDAETLEKELESSPLLVRAKAGADIEIKASRDRIVIGGCSVEETRLESSTRECG